MKTRNPQHQLIAEIAIIGLNHSLLGPEERADFYDGLSTLLAAPLAESAKYAATCLRECQRAQQELLAGLGARKERVP